MADNKNYFVLDDFHFTKLQKLKERDFDCYPTIDIPNTDVHVNNSIWSDGIVFQLFAFRQW